MNARRRPTRLFGAAALILGVLAMPHGSRPQDAPSSAPTPVAMHSATWLSQGRLLIAGGVGPGGPSDALQIFGPSSAPVVHAFATSRMSHSATLLPDGTVLMAGGQTTNGVLASLETVDGTGRTTPLPMPLARAVSEHATVLVPDGRALVLGGRDGAGAIVSTVQAVDVAGAHVVELLDLGLARAGHTATLLADGRVLVAGGAGAAGALSSVEFWDPARSVSAPSATSLSTPRSGHAALLLPSGDVLLVGGLGRDGKPLATLETFDPATGDFRPSAVGLSTPRSRHSATLLPSGEVLVWGGIGPAGTPLASAELIDPRTGAVRVVGASPASGLSVDQTPPTMLWSRPASGATDVALAGPIVLGFGEPLATTTVTASTVMLESSAGRVEARVVPTGDGLVAWVTPIESLAPAMTYTLVPPLGTVSYPGYDSLRRRTQMQVPGQALVAYQWDAASRLTQITQGTMQVTFGYDDANRRTSLTLPNGVVTQYAYDSASQVTALTYGLGQTTLGGLQYIYDAAGNRVRTAGTWARTTLPTAVASTTYNANNQQLTFGGQNLAYDLNGNLTSDGTNTYTWDGRNRLVALGGPVAASFVYDATTRRSRKTINGVTTDFIYDGLNPVQEQAGSTTTNVLTGVAVDEYFRRGDAVNVAWFLSDGLGSTIALVDPAGAVQTSYTYEPFGATTITGVPSSNPHSFTAREEDLPGLRYYRARYYHPHLQRFISEDPIGLRGGINVYAYAENQPVRFRDPLGLDVTISLYRCCGGFGHVGIGVNVDSPRYTVGFYPVSQGTPLSPGAVLPDSWRGDELIASITLRTTEEQDRIIENFINDVTRNPGRYNVFGTSGRQCGVFVQQALEAAGIQPLSTLVASPLGIFRLLESLNNAGVDFSQGVSPGPAEPGARR